MFGECCPFVVPKVLARAISLTQTANNLKQTLAASNVPQTVLFNVVPLASTALVINTVNGETTMVKAFDGMVTVSLNVIREATG
ncbi:hypothetical protein [Shewanella sp. NIFS-20-20]|uniref:hypothetical protein n=1 Tax=Shewanella sp. NIFS-20-20 TaxID=2853806 RepID=UPI001C45959F|nr:hypothetical protein [Shewanella sp. NIFS-20-20]MBV7315455.1 hypothetical protein [Shewanella sp. NIFS-20-20]